MFHINAMVVHTRLIQVRFSLIVHRVPKEGSLVASIHRKDG